MLIEGWTDAQDFLIILCKECIKCIVGAGKDMEFHYKKKLFNMIEIFPSLDVDVQTHYVVSIAVFVTSVNNLSTKSGLVCEDRFPNTPQPSGPTMPRPETVHGESYTFWRAPAVGLPARGTPQYVMQTYKVLCGLFGTAVDYTAAVITSDMLKRRKQCKGITISGVSMSPGLPQKQYVFVFDCGSGSTPRHAHARKYEGVSKSFRTKL
jgi:hypothetical protein